MYAIRSYYVSGLRVLARNSSFAFKGEAFDMKDTAARLGVRHILEGSVRKMGSKIRVNAQLVITSYSIHYTKLYDKLKDKSSIIQFYQL